MLSSLVGEIPKRHEQQPKGPEQTGKLVDDHSVLPAMTTTSTTNYVSEQSNIAAGSGIVVANAESSTTRLRARASGRGLPSADPLSPTGHLQPLVDTASNNTWDPIQSLIQQFVPREWAFKETAGGAKSLQHLR